jgi:DNA-binding response OmpR family regulator
MLPKVLIVEDDPVSALILQVFLEAYDYKILSVAYDTNSSKSKLNVFTPDIALIDIDLAYPREGIDIADFIHTKRSCPFIYLSSHADKEVLLRAQENEPYGYLIKPFDPSTLHATIQIALHNFQKEQNLNDDIKTLNKEVIYLKNLLYGKNSSDKTIIEFSQNYHYDLQLEKTFYKNIELRLTKKENAFIHLLISQQGTSVDFAQALNYVWEYKSVSSNSIKTLVWRLRKKIPSKLIISDSGTGYYIQ